MYTLYIHAHAAYSGGVASSTMTVRSARMPVHSAPRMSQMEKFGKKFADKSQQTVQYIICYIESQTFFAHRLFE